MQHSNAYTIGFAAAVCAVCGFFVAFSAVALKDRQDRNILIDRQKNVLGVAGLMRLDESLGADEISSRFNESIRAKVIDLASGKPNDSIDAVTFDQRRASRDPATSALAPGNAAKILRLPSNALIYEVFKQGEFDSMILPVEGTGLWSVLYGYIALSPDARTIRGITFYEHGETAGLGGEVDNPRWKAKWIGRKAFNQLDEPAIAVKKGTAGPSDVDPHQVDGLAGATITSRGVTHLVRFWLGENGFGPYLKRYRAEKGI